MAKTKTFCRICEAQCGLVVEHNNNQVIKIEPNNDHLVSKGYACIKGLKMGEFAHSPDRLQTPLKKVNGEFQAVSWNQALTEIGAKLKAIHSEHGGDCLLYTSPSPRDQRGSRMPSSA